MVEMDKNKRGQRVSVGSVRKTDIEPYTALKWVGTLFKSAAVFLAVAVVGEFVAGIRFEGLRALPILMGELARTTVFAVLMWGAGDLARLLITVGNDIRAERILLGRLVDRTPGRRAAEKAAALEAAAEPAPLSAPAALKPAAEGEAA
jgi:hypothetical protein